MENRVCIKIKSPSAQYQDLELSCDIQDSVIHVKKRIADEFPTKPSVSGQKLVYSGKILKDLDKLSEILRFEDEVTKFTFHLVCAVPQKKSSVGEENTSPSFPDGLRQRPSPSTATPPSSSYTGGQQQDQMDQMMREFSNQYSEAMASMSTNPSDQEMAAMQQLYNQYVSVYMQYIQSQALVTGGQQYQFIANNQVDLNHPEADHHHHEAAPGPVPEAAVPNNPGLVMNAGAAAGQIQDMGGDRQRDLLDWVYVMTRVVLLISVIYFHSSFLRLAFVAGLGFLVYIYQNRIRQRHQQQQAVQQQRERDQAAAAQQQQQQRNNSEDGAEDNENVTNEETEDEAITEPPAPGKFAVIVTFFTSLVSSIIPEQPQVI